MISFESIPRDFSQLQRSVGEYLSNRARDLLESEFSSSVKYLVVERPYVDRDHRSIFYADLSKRHRLVERDSIRIHLFKNLNSENLEDAKLVDSDYLGFFTLRKFASQSIGRSYIAPSALQNRKGWAMLAKYKVNLLGQTLEVEAFPWMQQDNLLSRCSHVATWSIMRYFGQKQSTYPDRTLAELLSYFYSHERKVPSSGMTMEQMSQTLGALGFSPEIVARTAIDKTKKSTYFESISHSYIESGIPLIASLRHIQHAIVIKGHGEVASARDYVKSMKISTPRIVDSANLVGSFICSDDNFLPYRNLNKTKASNWHSLFPPFGLKKPVNSYSFEDITSIAVPLHDKMYVTPKELFQFFLPLFEREASCFKNNIFVRRVFLTSSKALKKFAFANFGKDYRNIILMLPMPKFVWIVEYATPSDYDDHIVEHRIIIDSTSSTFDLNSIILFQQNKHVFLPDSDKPSIISSYRTPIIKNNLERMN